MTESNDRAPGAVAAQSLAMRPLYSRTRWEEALLASDLHQNARLVGLLLAHLAGDAGHIPRGKVQGTRHLAPLVRLKPRFVTVSKNCLEARGFIERPPADGWTANVCRPITLTLPAQRPERPKSSHTGGPR